MRKPPLKQWLRRKEEFRRRIAEDREIGYLDPGIEEVLRKFFERSKSYTTSSCSGRITIVDAEKPWTREGSTVVFRSHDPVSLEEVMSILSKPASHTFWLVAAGPIIHVVCYDEEEAYEVLRIAREAGFKHSGILSKTSKGIIVELRTGIRIVAPLKEKDRVLVGEEYLARLIDHANNAVAEGRERLRRLARVLEEARPRGGGPNFYNVHP